LTFSDKICVKFATNSGKVIIFVKW
jgi:hypothetical protein